jgi:dihydroorotase
MLIISVTFVESGVRRKSARRWSVAPFVETGRTVSREYKFEGSVAMIGSAPTHDIVIPDIEPDHHIAISHKNNAVWVDATTSAAVTRVNGEPLVGHRLLRPTDRITIGNSTIQVELRRESNRVELQWTRVGERSLRGASPDQVVSPLNTVDLVIRGGRVIDPTQGIDAIRDVVIQNGRIVNLPRSAEALHARESIDATGKIITPGLIDMHVHVFHGLSTYGLDPDQCGIRSGVTHVNDMGSTGCFTFLGFRNWVAPNATSDLTCFPNILGFGVPENWVRVATGVGLDSIVPDELIRVAQENPTMIRGVKVQFEPGAMSWFGKHSVSSARRVCDELGLPLYMHLGQLMPIKNEAVIDPDKVLDEAMEFLRPGDLVGHANSAFAGSLIRIDGSLHPTARELRRLGLFTETGWGLNATFAATRTLLDNGLAPDIISSDAHSLLTGRAPGSPDIGEGSGATLAGTMTKMWACGMPLIDVIRGATAIPAKILGLDDRKGSLKAGFVADLTIIDPVEGNWELRDAAGERLHWDRALVPWATIKAGKVMHLEPFRLVEFRREFVPAGVRLAGIQPARRLNHCRRVASQKQAGAIKVMAQPAQPAKPARGER